MQSHRVTITMEVTFDIDAHSKSDAVGYLEKAFAKNLPKDPMAGIQISIPFSGLKDWPVVILGAVAV